ncbi:diaminopimelate epimerase [Blattabacterium sp. (Blattella germanica) str. Bge]|uniref:diaminopimelate epimerase n=1 Tax=Blattabacterium sp. (Blattella germanica) TaxID=624186 RepID=UPI0001BB61CC|nr:diaminopimelate epimerase [Blattabacterium sp. (Blattella germanica)]ACY40406.1 diaminopimelate epimerase [Blattabacterium sp. (Blattella germanica) str. Bge]
MKFNFFKYQGTGNDFILLDDRTKKIVKEYTILKKLCNRHFGIGADGIILIQNDSKSDFYMQYYNSDGKESTMCGNGGRCAIFFAKKLGINKENKIHFRAIDGHHYGLIIKNEKNDKCLVSINLINIQKNEIEIHPEHVFLNTGSPHHIIFVENIKEINVYEEGKKIRFRNPYLKKGVNVNFVEILENKTLQVRTYERGVENETLSCGTGVTASVIAAYETNRISSIEKILVHTIGGKLWVSLKETKNEYKDIYLTGSVQFIFQGCIFI